MFQLLNDGFIRRELIGLSGYLICLIFHVTSISTNHWSRSISSSSSGYHVTLGLWRQCRSDNDVSEVCTQITTESRETSDYLKWKNSAQLLMLVALFSLLLQIILVMATMLLKPLNNYKRVLRCIVLWLLALYCACVYMVMVSYAFDTMRSTILKLSWSWDIAVCAFIFTLISGIVTAFDLLKELRKLQKSATDLVHRFKYREETSVLNRERRLLESESTLNTLAEDNGGFGFRTEHEMSFQKKRGASLMDSDTTLSLGERNGGFVFKTQDENGIWMVSF